MSAQYKLTALLNKNHLGYAKITHPYHPFHGQSFPILKIKNISGIETLSLKHPTRGSFAVSREWTDQAKPSSFEFPKEYTLILEPSCLLELIEFITKLKEKKE